MKPKPTLREQIAAVKEQRDIMRKSYQNVITKKIDDAEAFETVRCLNAALETLRKIARGRRTRTAAGQ